MKLNKSVFDKWFDWTDKIRSDLTNIVNNQQIYKHFEDVVRTNWDHIIANKGYLFCDFIKECYGIQAALGIRRHIKIDDESISLMNLIDQIKKCAKQFNYEFYLDRYPINSDIFEWQKSTFNNFSKNGVVLSEEIIDKDIKALEQIGGKVSDFVDRVMAHLDKRGPKENLTYGDLMESINLFNKMTCKYLTLITGDGHVTLEPTIQLNWKRIFNVPLDVRKYDDL